VGVCMVGTERVNGCIYSGNRESGWVYIWGEHREGVGVYMVGTERVSGCIYGGNIESEWVYIWWEQGE
jgi:hypothetical protein